MRVLTMILAMIAGVAMTRPALAQTAETASRSCVPAPAPAMEQQVFSGGRQRTYRLYVPAGVDGRTPLPLVMDLHGSGGTSAGQARTSGLETLAAKGPFIVATLQAEASRWNVPPTGERADDVAYVSDVIDHVASRACTDLTRVYATGFSGGGRMTSLLACRLGARLAAVAPVAGLRWPGPCEGAPVPILSFHGLADRQNPYEGQATGRGAEWLESVPDALAAWARHNGCSPDAVAEDPPGPLSTIRYEQCRAGAEIRLIRIDELAHTWPRDPIDATTAMWQFFQQHARRQP